MSPQVDPIDVPATLQKAAEMCASGRDRTAFDLLEAAVARSDDPRLALAAAKIALAWDSDRALLLAELAVSRGSADQDVYRVLATALDSSGEWTRAHRLRIEADLSPSRAYRRHRRRQVLGIVAGTAAAAATLAAIAAIVLWPSISLDGWGENATHIVADRAALNAPPGALELELTPPMLAVSGRTVCAQVDGAVTCDTANHYLYSDTRVAIPGEPTGWGTQDGSVCVATTDGKPRCVGKEGVVEQSSWWVEISETCGLLPSGALECLDGTHWDGPFAQLATSPHATCGLDKLGGIHCEGESPYAPGPPGTYVKLLGHDDGFCALRDDGAPICWGAKVIDADSPHGVDLALTHARGRDGSSLTTVAVLAPDRRTIQVKDRRQPWRAIRQAPEPVTSLAVGSAVCATFESGAVRCEHQGWHTFPFPDAEETAASAL